MIFIPILNAWSFFGLFDDDEEPEPVVEFVSTFVPTGPIGYEELRLFRADGTTIFDMDGSVDDCKLACTTDNNCSGFEHNIPDNRCWLKNGKFWETRKGTAASNLYIQHKSADFQPFISATADVDVVYDHYDYLKGIDDINNTIKSILSSDEVAFHVHLFYMDNMIDLDISNIEDHLDTVNRKHQDNGSPILFHLANATRIPNEAVDVDDNEKQAMLESTYGVTEPNTVTIFCGDLGFSAGGFAGLPSEGDLNKRFVYIDTTWPVFLGQFGQQDVGEVLAHELGHWLGLHHTFDNECYPGDYVIDTPPATSEDRDAGWSWFWIPGLTSKKTCGYAKDQIENIMDYVSVRTKFTPGQVYRMMIFAFYKQIGRMPQYENGIIV